MNEDKLEKWILLLGVLIIWMIDNFTTIYFINGDYGVKEANLIPAYFFSLDIPGYISYFLLAVSFLIILIIFLPLWMGKLRQDKEYERLFRWLMSGAVIGMEVVTIISNLIMVGYWFL